MDGFLIMQCSSFPVTQSAASAQTKKVSGRNRLKNAMFRKLTLFDLVVKAGKHDNSSIPAWTRFPESWRFSMVLNRRRGGGGGRDAAR